MTDDKKCSGIRTTGYWKGHPCGTSPTIFKKNKWWCKNHVPMNISGKEDVAVHSEDLWHLLICTLRYSMGRRTYMPSYTCEMIKRYAPHLSKEYVKKIYKELKDELERYEADNETMGDKFDHEMWRNFLKEEITESEK